MLTLSLPLVLASNSPRRRELLSQLVDSFQVHASAIEEQRQADEPLAQYVERLAREKAQAVAPNYPNCWVLGADTIVVCDGQLFEKPEDEADARRMLQALSAKSHTVYTAIALVKGGDVHLQNVATQVTFRALSDAEITAYWQSGEPTDKAGGYGIQGIAARFVERIDGSYSAVVGLPLCETYQMLQHVMKEK